MKSSWTLKSAWKRQGAARKGHQRQDKAHSLRCVQPSHDGPAARATTRFKYYSIRRDAQPPGPDSARHPIPKLTLPGHRAPDEPESFAAPYHPSLVRWRRVIHPRRAGALESYRCQDPYDLRECGSNSHGGYRRRTWVRTPQQVGAHRATHLQQDTAPKEAILPIT